MLDGPSVAAALKACGVSHVVWVPDSELGTWEPALLATEGLRLIRVCREGEAFAVAAGLALGGARPLVLLQCIMVGIILDRHWDNVTKVLARSLYG